MIIVNRFYIGFFIFIFVLPVVAFSQISNLLEKSYNDLTEEEKVQLFEYVGSQLNQRANKSAQKKPSKRRRVGQSSPQTSLKDNKGEPTLTPVQILNRDISRAKRDIAFLQQQRFDRAKREQKRNIRELLDKQKEIRKKLARIKRRVDFVKNKAVIGTKADNSSGRGLTRSEIGVLSMDINAKIQRVTQALETIRETKRLEEAASIERQMTERSLLDLLDESSLNGENEFLDRGAEQTERLLLDLLDESALNGENEFLE